jgi:4-amino-4-deoxy-L-arabinose transferase-like glycosyltransferase
MTAHQDTRTQHWFRAWSHRQSPDLVPMSLILAGFLPRFFLAWFTFLNPDEILHYLLSDQASLRLAYQASLTTAHPPLFIVFLYYWRMLGHAEWVLRLPSVLAGTAFCWITFLWLNKVANRPTALTGLALLLFSPSLIHLSSEIRQYALLLCFSAIALYFLECAFTEQSVRMMLLSFVALYIALLTHYSALIFALSIALYALARPYRGTEIRVAITWIVGQVAALVLCVFLYATHISRLKSSGQPLEIDTWLASSIYHPGRDHVVVFLFRTTIRLFHFLFSQGAVGVLGFLFFVIGVAGLCMGDRRFPPAPGRPGPRQLGLLLVLPFVVNCSLALAGLYPYGGTRHNAVLAGFAMSGIAIGLSRWTDHGRWGRPLVLAVALVLVVCNVFPTPTGAYIQPRNQSKKLMEESLQFVRQIPPGSVLLTDNGGGLSLSYYLCHQRVIQYELPFKPFLQSDWSGLHLITPAPNFKTLPDRSALSAIDPHIRETPSAQVWFFQAGWIAGKEDIRRTMLQTGCRDPRKFGQNILLCQL